MHEAGLKTTKKRIEDWYTKNNIEIISEKEIIKELVIYLKNEDNSRGYKKIANLCKEQGYDVPPNTVKNILKR